MNAEKYRDDMCENVSQILDLIFRMMQESPKGDSEAAAKKYSKILECLVRLRESCDDMARLLCKEE